MHIAQFCAGFLYMSYIILGTNVNIGGSIILHVSVLIKEAADPADDIGRRGGEFLSQNNSGASLIQFFGLFDTLHSLQLVYLTLLSLIDSTLAFLISM